MQKGFSIIEYGNTRIYEIPSFKNTGLVRHGFTTRLGGCGARPYDTLNLAFHVGDVVETVVKNREVVCEVLGAEMSRLVCAQQVHGVNIAVVGAGQAARGAFTYATALPDTDGLLTNEPGLLLATFYADCVPIFLLDPVKGAIGCIHAGWKGTVAGIGARAVEKMAEAFGSQPTDLLAGIGPSVGPCCYEVDEPVINAFRREFHWSGEVLATTAKGKAILNLWEANRNILTGAGIVADNVELSQVCTCCNQDLLFSHRGSGGITGRMGAFIMLKGE